MQKATILAVVLVAVATGQWSEPVPVVEDLPWPNTPHVDLRCGAGDTLWAFYILEHWDRDSTQLVAHWGMGDFWPVGSVLTSDTNVSCLGTGVDPAGRVWVSWYNGDYLIDGDTWGIWTRVHDSDGWGEPTLALRGPDSIMAYPGGQSFAADREGNWYMGIAESHAPYPDLYTSALYSRLQGDSWIWPRPIAIGYGSPVYVDHHLPTLVAHPDSGLWSVHTRTSLHEKPCMLLDWVVGDTVIALASIDSCWTHQATADSSGRLWVIYESEDTALRSVTFEHDSVVDSRVITRDPSPLWWINAYACTDPDGWVWTTWTRLDSTPVVSFNRGLGWSEPEPVTDSVGWAYAIASDRDGRIYVLYQTPHRSLFTVYREIRPGVAGERTKAEDGGPGPTHVRHALTLPGRQPASLLDITGRRVMDLMPGENDVRHLAPGVYFVLRASGVEREASNVHKVVIQR